MDLAGDDEYMGGLFSQGCGQPVGAGLLIDAKGNDSYKASATAYVSSTYGNQPLNMSQGVGVGRRADFSDGHQMPGGVGGLVDGAGDDSYQAYIWSQGAAFWWGFGFLEDLGGNDKYQATQYSQGAAAHFAIGSLVDLSGNDIYNVEGKNTQMMGHGHDAGLGIFVDGDGDDVYRMRSTSLGASQLNAIGVFWDRRGNDIYKMVLRPKNDHYVGLGESRVFQKSPSLTHRDKMPTIGVFLDTGGTDMYVDVIAPERERELEQPITAATNNSVWQFNRIFQSYGYGLDVELYEKSTKKSGSGD